MLDFILAYDIPVGIFAGNNINNNRIDRMKKNPTHKGMMYCILIIALIIVFWWGLATWHKDEFDPEKDDCDKWKCLNCAGFDECIPEGEGCFTLKYCEEYHPKSKCEISPESPGCVCDEYSTYKTCEERIMHYKYHTLKELYDAQRYCSRLSYYCIIGGEAIYIGEEQTRQGWGDLLNLLNATILSVECTTEECPIEIKNGSCIKSHEATLSDLSCPELLDYYENGNECVNNMWVGPISCKYPREEYDIQKIDYSDKQILSEYLKRCIQ